MKYLVSVLVVALATTALSAAPSIAVTAAGVDTVGNEIYELHVNADGMLIAGFDVYADNIITVGAVCGGALPAQKVWNNHQIYMTFGEADSFVDFNTDDVLITTSIEPGDGTLEGTVALYVPEEGKDERIFGNETSRFIAQLVVAPGTEGTFTFNFGDGSANPPSVVSGSVGVPEPATMSLLAIGGVAALIRRKR